MNLSWQSSSQSIKGLSPPEQEWLCYRGSMTQKMQGVCTSVKIDLLKQGFAIPRHDEAQLIGQPFHQVASIREVLMVCDHQPWLYARTIFPRTVLQGAGRRFVHLGKVPLGRLLFQEFHLQRGPIDFARMTEETSFHGWHADVLSSGVLARRSQFLGLAQPILLYEFFLPAMQHMILKRHHD